MVDWQMRPSTFFLLVFVAFILSLLFPGGTEFVIPVLSLPILIYMKHKNYIKKMDFWDFALIFAYVVIGTFLVLYLQIASLNDVPWWQIIIVGLAVDVTASLLGTVPVVGDIISAVLAFIIAMVVIGGITGAMIATIVMIISVLPGPSLGANTILLIIFKMFSRLTLGA